MHRNCTPDNHHDSQQNRIICPSDVQENCSSTVTKEGGIGSERAKINYRLASNLPFVSKILEKVVANGLEEHLESNSLHDDLQSAYRACHSTETALRRVHHDITLALDNNSCAVLVLLDLSAAFDIIDHPILMERLQYSYGITGQPLTWINSYLSNRKFYRLVFRKDLCWGRRNTACSQSRSGRYAKDII